MIEQQFYLTEPGMEDYLSELTELSFDEIEQLVGRFRQDHWRWPGKLKGEVLVYSSGKIRLRHHFTKKKIWQNI